MYQPAAAHDILLPGLSTTLQEATPLAPGGTRTFGKHERSVSRSDGHHEGPLQNDQNQSSSSVISKTTVADAKALHQSTFRSTNLARV